MTYTNSSLITYKNLSPNHSGERNHIIDTVSIHCMVAQWTAKEACDYFANPNVEASPNYVVGYDGSTGLSVEERHRSWCTSSRTNDNRAITIEVASESTHPYVVTDKALSALIELLADICKRNNIKRLLWKGDKSLIGQVDKQNMTVHRWFDNKACPGEYLYSKHSYIANEVNKLLGSNTGTTTITNTTTSSGNSNIKAVQKWLNSTYNADLDEDGIYGPLTKKALVKALQTELNRQCSARLDVDGIFGTKTKAAVCNLRKGFEGNLTKTLQGLLICNGYDTNGFDGIFGNGTESAVEAYQRNNGLSADGIAGKDTFSELCR